MGRGFRIHIDLPLLRRKLSAEDRRERSICEVRQWLHDAGFVPDGDAWLVREEDLGQLEPDEVTAVEIHETSNREVFD